MLNSRAGTANNLSLSPLQVASCQEWRRCAKTALVSFPTKKFFLSILFQELYFLSLSAMTRAVLMNPPLLEHSIGTEARGRGANFGTLTTPSSAPVVLSLLRIEAIGPCGTCMHHPSGYSSNWSRQQQRLVNSLPCEQDGAMAVARISPEDLLPYAPRDMKRVL